MFLNLNQIRTSHERVDQEYGPGAFDASQEAFRVAGPVALGFDVYKDDDEFRLVGAVKGRLGLACSRCLEPFELAVDAPFDLRYVPRARNSGEGDVEVREDDLTTAFYDDDQIDLGQLMREQFYLAMPMKPLCREDCRGLCPVCGTNLNVSTCACEPGWHDPRLAALKDLKH